MEKELVCIGCPKGCSIRVKPAADDTTAAADGKPAGTMEFTGYGCKRGLQYAFDECTHPVRTLTTTVRTSGHGGALVSVKSSKPLPKELLFDCMSDQRTYGGGSSQSGRRHHQKYIRYRY
jgi:CxxC motif-containing protein